MSTTIASSASNWPMWPSMGASPRLLVEGEKAGKSPVDRGKIGIKRSMMVDANGILLGVL